MSLNRENNLYVTHYSNFPSFLHSRERPAFRAGQYQCDCLYPEAPPHGRGASLD